MGEKGNVADTAAEAPPALAGQEAERAQGTVKSHAGDLQRGMKASAADAQKDAGAAGIAVGDPGVK